MNTTREEQFVSLLEKEVASQTENDPTVVYPEEFVSDGALLFTVSNVLSDLDIDHMNAGKVLDVDKVSSLMRKSEKLSWIVYDTVDIVQNWAERIDQSMQSYDAELEEDRSS